MEFALFGKDYETFMPFLEESQALMFKCAIMPRFGFAKPDEEKGPDGKPAPVECELKMRKMTLLANTKEEFIKKLTVNVPVKRITPEFRKELLKQLKEHKGKKMLSLNILDYEKGYSVEYFSRKYKIDINPGLLDFLQHNNLEYRVDAEVYL